MGIRINNLFDTDKNIIDELAKYGSYLPDHIFSQALSEFGLNDGDDEQKIMLEMMKSEKYIFDRQPEGWNVSEK